jgi:hypothetical protein
VATRSIAASVLESHISTRLLVACCGSITLLYAIGWRLVTLRLNPPTPAPVVEEMPAYLPVLDS